MITKIIIWLALIYIIIVVILRIIISITMIISSYAEDGWRSAIVAAVISFLVNLWDIAKFAFLLLFISFLFKSCSH